MGRFARFPLAVAPWGDAGPGPSRCRGAGAHLSPDREPPVEERRTVSAAPAAVAPEGDVRQEPADDELVARALGVPTRAGIYRRLRTEGQPLTAREVAEMFGLHPNVARTHLDTLAEADLVVTGRRKHPGGGRPAKVYVAREQARTGTDVQVPPGSQLAVHTIVQLIAGLAEHREKLALLAEAQGRKLVAAAAGRADTRDFHAAAVIAVEALRAAFPEVRLAEVEGDAAVVEGLEVGLKLVGEVDGQVGDALAVGFLRGALAAAGAPATVEARAGRVTATLDEAGLGAQPSPVATVDVRGETFERGVVATMRAIVPLRPGDHLEVLTDGQGAPAAFARWADRAGHQIVDVARVRDVKGSPAVRVLLRKATGR
ncbi:helix-turn-helix domain-containing protein [Nitriliruptoraceae bacterium ZYF776]|nr:helix-turn-helix domain-containing protein [Profundirhabdus halotolerans]